MVFDGSHLIAVIWKRVRWVVTLFCIVSGSWLHAQQGKVSPYPESDVITDIQFEWPTHTRLAPGSDNWPVTWADDNAQYTVWGDGGGFGGTNERGRSSIGVARIAGDWDQFSAANMSI